MLGKVSTRLSWRQRRYWILISPSILEEQLCAVRFTVGHRCVVLHWLQNSGWCREYCEFKMNLSCDVALGQ